MLYLTIAFLLIGFRLFCLACEVKEAHKKEV